VWEAATGRETFSKHGRPTQSTVASGWEVAFSHNGGWVAMEDEDGTVRLWDVATDQPIGEPMKLKPDDRVTAMAFSPDDSILLTESQDTTGQFWDVATGRPTGASITHQAEVFTVAFSPDGKVLVTGSQDGLARLWDVATGQPVGRPMEHQAPVRA